jgi:hypothetical protein
MARDDKVGSGIEADDMNLNLLAGIKGGPRLV